MGLKTENGRVVFAAQDDAGNGINLIGASLAWKYATSEFRTADVISAWESVGFDVTGLRKNIGRRDDVKRALNKMKNDALLREVSSSPSSVRYQFTEQVKTILENGKLAISFQAKEFIVYDLQNDSFFFEDSAGNFSSNPERENALKELIDYCALTFTNSQVSIFTKKLLEKECRQIGISRGVYFVPARSLETVYKLEKVFEKIDPAGTFVLTEIPDMSRAKKAVAKSGQEIIAERAKSVVAKINEIVSGKNELTRTVKKNAKDELDTLVFDTKILMECTQNSMADSRFQIDAARVMLEAGDMNGNVKDIPPMLLRALLTQHSRQIEDMAEFGFSQDDIDKLRTICPDLSRNKIEEEIEHEETGMVAPEIDIEL
jgi:hypothetical protein